MINTNAELIGWCHAQRHEAIKAIARIDAGTLSDGDEDASVQWRSGLSKIISVMNEIIERDWQTRVMVAGHP